MLRNQDRPELLLFVTTNAARWTDGSARPGVERLVAEAADAGTPSLWICEDNPKPVGDLKPTPWPNAPSLPCPQALQDARAEVDGMDAKANPKRKAYAQALLEAQ